MCFIESVTSQSRYRQFFFFWKWEEAGYLHAYSKHLKNSAQAIIQLQDRTTDPAAVMFALLWCLYFQNYLNHIILKHIMEPCEYNAVVL